MLVRQKSMNSVLNPKGLESKKFEKLEQKTTSRQSSLISLSDSSVGTHTTSRMASFTGGSNTANTTGGNSPNSNQSQSFSERDMSQPTTPTKKGQNAMDTNFSQHSIGGGRGIDAFILRLTLVPYFNTLSITISITISIIQSNPPYSLFVHSSTSHLITIIDHILTKPNLIEPNVTSLALWDSSYHLSTITKHNPTLT